MRRHIHIISFNIPFPPDYGGVIDVYFKIKALKKAGIDVSLHCFQYGREKSPELEKLCKKVYYYPRKTGFASHLHFIPYIIRSRRSLQLLQNIQTDKDPIFFEGLHSTSYLPSKELEGRLKIVRAHNVEHKYYFKLFRSEKKISKKLFFFIESVKLLLSEKRLKHADYIAAISEKEQQHFQHKFGSTFLLNAFHSCEKVNIHTGKGKYLLYHGNLSIPENIKAVNYLMEKVFNQIDFQVIIAGKNPSRDLLRKVSKYKNIQLIASPGQKKMKDLINNAQANVLYSFQNTGSKLKLLESLFHGRHCVANPEIFGGSRLKELCETGSSAVEILIKVRKILNSDFTDEMVRFRKKVLRDYDNAYNARRLIEKLEESERF